MDDFLSEKDSQKPNNLLDDDDSDDLFKSAITTSIKKEEKLDNIFSDPLVEDINLNDEEDEAPAPTAQSTSLGSVLQPAQLSFLSSNIPPAVSSTSSSPQPSEPASIATTTISSSTPFASAIPPTPVSLPTQINPFKVPNLASEPTTVTTIPGGNVVTGPNAASVAAQTNAQYIEIEVTDPRKCGDGMGSYVLYKVTTRTNLRFFRKDLISVDRRFSDFLGLRDKLAEKHLHLGRIVPPAPEKDAYNTAKVKMVKDEMSADDFLEKRSAALQRFLNRVAAHPSLLSDPDFREFLELDSVLPRAKNTSALSGAGMKRLLNRMGETVNKMTFKMDESDPWFEEKQHQIENLDQQLRKLHASVEALIHHRRELTSTTGQFAKSAAILGNCEEHSSLSCALSQLSETEEKLEQLYCDQANSDFFYLAETIKDYINLIGVVKDVFHYRVKVYQTWQHAQQTLTKKREAKTRLELTGRTDKLAQATDEVTEWESKVTRGQEEFEGISKTIKGEVEKFEITRIRDFKSNIIKYMESLLETQQQIIKYWEAFLPEAQAIA